jgi:hypothetical protein
MTRRESQNRMISRKTISLTQEDKRKGTHTQANSPTLRGVEDKVV